MKEKEKEEETEEGNFHPFGIANVLSYVTQRWYVRKKHTGIAYIHHMEVCVWGGGEGGTECWNVPNYIN